MKRMQEMVVFLTVTSQAIGVIFFQFGQTPANLSYDEIEFTKLALSLNNLSYHVYSPLATGHSTLYFYILLLSLKLFGISAIALRIPAAIFGVFNVILFYFINKLIWKKNSAAFVASVVFLFLRWYFNFARFGFEATFLLFLELSSLLFFFIFLKNKLLRYLLVSAFFAGLAFHSYQPGRMFFLLPLAVLLLRREFKLLFYYAGTVTFVASPLIFYLMNNSDLRVNEISLFTDNHLSIFQKIEQFIQNIGKNVGMIFFDGDMNGRHNFPGKPALNPIWGILFVAGLAWNMTKNKKVPVFLFLSYLIISFIPSLLTHSSENPNMLRTFTATASVAFFISAPLIMLLNKSKNKIINFIVIGVFILIPVFYELRTYFVFQSRVVKNSFEITCPLQEVIQYSRYTIPKKCRVSKNMF